MFYLDKLKDSKLYANIQITALEQSKNSRTSNLVYFSGNKDGDLINFINSQLLNPSYFRAVYVPKFITTIRMNRKITVDQKAFYDNIRSNCSNIISVKRGIGDYKNNNLIYDLTMEYGNDESEIKVRGKQRITYYLSFLIKKIQEGSKYKDKIIIIPVPSNITDNSYYDLNKVNNPFSYTYCALKRQLLTDEEKKAIEGVTFLFYSLKNNSFVKFTYSSDLDSSLISNLIMRLNTLVKIENNQKLDETDEQPVDKEELIQGDEGLKKEIQTKEKVTAVKEKILTQLNANPNNKNSVTVVELSDKIEDHIADAVSDVDITDKSEDEIIGILNKSKDVKDDVSSIKDIQNTNGDEIKQKQVLQKLQDKQKSVNFDDTSIQSIIDEFKSTSIDSYLITNTNVLQDETKKSNLKDFDISYHTKQMKKDLISVLSAFNNDNDVKMYITDIKSEDTSNDLSKKVTYSVSFQDDRNVKHTIKFDYPVIKDGRFMNINGGKKLILKQILLLPIVKTKPDTVQITTNYNKFFIMRFGSKLTHKTEKLKKFFGSNLEEFKKPDKKFKVRLGNALTINSNYETTLEYGEFSSFLLEIESDKVRLLFNQNEIDDLIENDMASNKKLSSIQYDKAKYNIIGHNKEVNALLGMSFVDKHVYTLDGKSENLYSNSIADIVISAIKDSLTEDAFSKLSGFANSKTLAFNRVKINNKLIPLVVLLGYELGLKALLERYKVNYTFETKNTRFGLEDSKDKIKFKDGFLIYDNSLLRNSLLLDGLSVMATEEYNFEEFDDKIPYTESFYELFGSRNMGKGFHNTLSLMVDPITLDVLKNLKLPENIYDILLYANTLLEDATYKKLNDMSSYRIRGAEQVNAFLYKMLADSFRTYKDTMKAGNPIKMSVPQDALLKMLLESKTVDEYSVLNPSLEIEKIGAATYKGLAGINLDSAYTKEIRAYDPSMVGIFAISTPDSDKVGVVRQLSYDPSLINTRGFLDTNRDTKNDSTNIYGPAELLNSFTGCHADPPRIGIECVCLHEEICG